jgi:glycosyltransferase involved in cell wall biosynthesis
VDSRDKTFFVIPAFNEEASIRQVVSGIVKEGFSAVVVDDSSSDKTREVAREGGAWVVSHPINLGQGAALQTGFEFALANDAKFVVTFDADGQHLVKDAIEMVTLAAAQGLDVVIGSRFLRGRPESIPLSRYVILKLAVLFTRFTTRLDVSDTHNGLRVFSASSARLIQLQHNRMAHASEILSQIAKLKLKWAEHPTDILYTDYSIAKGQKSSNFVSIIFELLMGRFK